MENIETKETKTKRKKKLSTSALVLIVATLIIMIPVVIFLAILGTSYLGNDKPVLGHRFDNDLNPAITSGNISTIEKNVQNLNNVEKVEVLMPTAQLRINIDVADSLSREDIEEICKSAYEIVDKEVPVSTYFTQSSDGKKMYDLEINAYNYIPSEPKDENWISCVLTKNSSMSEYSSQFVDKPINQDLADRLNGVSNTTTDVIEPETSE